jgi:hypothetical protein
MLYASIAYLQVHKKCIDLYGSEAPLFELRNIHGGRGARLSASTTRDEWLRDDDLEKQ